VEASHRGHRALPDGLAQRLGNVVFLSWYLLVSFKLVRSGREDAMGHDGARAAAT